MISSKSLILNSIYNYYNINKFLLINKLLSTYLWPINESLKIEVLMHGINKFKIITKTTEFLQNSRLVEKDICFSMNEIFLFTSKTFY
jgi:hypothetical protein